MQSTTFQQKIALFFFFLLHYIYLTALVTLQINAKYKSTKKLNITIG